MCLPVQKHQHQSHLNATMRFHQHQRVSFLPKPLCLNGFEGRAGGTEASAGRQQFPNMVRDYDFPRPVQRCVSLITTLQPFRPRGVRRGPSKWRLKRFEVQGPVFLHGQGKRALAAVVWGWRANTQTTHPQPVEKSGRYAMPYLPMEKCFVDPPLGVSLLVSSFTRPTSWTFIMDAPTDNPVVGR